MAKILILYATAGIGHKKAAYAIKEAFDEVREKDVQMEDSLDYTSGFFKASYNATYLFFIKYIPLIWGLFYYLLDVTWFYNIFIRPLRRLTNLINTRQLVRFLIESKPEMVIVTHFLALEVIADLKRKGLFTAPLIAVVTDYKSHTFWLSDLADYYVAASEYTKVDLVKRGIRPERILVYGIPCGRGFSEERDRGKGLLKIGLDPSKKTLFVLSGGFGVGPIKGVTLEMDKSPADFQGIVVCGYNKELEGKIKTIAKDARHKFKVYGFVDNVDELMHYSDVLVSKPGGISTTESLAAEVPMIVMKPIPGQEMRNYKFLEQNHAALKIKKPEEIVSVLDGLFESGKLEDLKKNIKKIRCAHSAEKIVDFCEEHVGK